jgi:hypothetical protein
LVEQNCENHSNHFEPLGNRFPPDIIDFQLADEMVAADLSSLVHLFRMSWFLIPESAANVSPVGPECYRVRGHS